MLVGASGSVTGMFTLHEADDGDAVGQFAGEAA